MIEQGLLVKVDALGQVEWQQRIVSPDNLGQIGCAISQVLPLPQSGEFMVAGIRVTPPVPGGAAQRYENYYIARYRPTTNASGAYTGGAPVWEWQGFPNPYYPSVALRPNGTAVTAMSHVQTQPTPRDLYYTRLAGLPAYRQCGSPRCARRPPWRP